MWVDLLAGLGLVLVIEGLLPFLSPRRFRQSLLNFAALEERVMRVIGLVCMVRRRHGVLRSKWVRGAPDGPASAPTSHTLGHRDAGPGALLLNALK